jgi:hypothetical protein
MRRPAFDFIWQAGFARSFFVIATTIVHDQIFRFEPAEAIELASVNYCHSRGSYSPVSRRIIDPTSRQIWPVLATCRKLLKIAAPSTDNRNNVATLPLKFAIGNASARHYLIGTTSSDRGWLLSTPGYPS